MNSRAGRLPPAWRYLFAAGLLGLGVISIAYADFALQWQPIPASLPARDGIALFSGGILVVGGIGVCVPLIEGGAAWLLSTYLMIFWVLPQLVAVAGHPGSLGLWLGVFETAAVAAGAWMLVAAAGREKMLPWCRRVFAAACLIFGLSHIVYAGFTAQMIPPWFARRIVLAYATGVAHMAAGVAIFSNVVPRLAALLEALMMTSFVVFVHLPSIGKDPPPDWAASGRIQLTALFWAMTVTGSAWIMAGSFDTDGMQAGSANPGRHG